MNREQLRAEIRDAIWFYESRGWDWLDLVAYLIWRYRHG